MKNKTFWKSIKCAVRGTFKAFKTEKNFLIYAIHVVVTLIINVLVGFQLWQYVAWGITIFGVFSAEFVNTAIERTCDLINEDFDRKIKDIKDIAAAAVSTWGLAFYAMEILNIGLCLFVYR